VTSRELLVGTSPRNDRCFPVDRDEAHREGVPHRAVHIEVVDLDRRLLVWRRRDGRLEIPGGHVDWIATASSPESYDEAALRELREELALGANWSSSQSEVASRLRASLAPVATVVNQLPSSQGYNNEWVAIYRLVWQPDWGDPSSSSWRLDEREGASEPWWRTLDDIEAACSGDPKLANAALRLLLRRRGSLIPLTPQQPRAVGWPTAR
jgi:8-oxo-dGTP pyrophosphatase MutT (NUDIX family)